MVDHCAGPVKLVHACFYVRKDPKSSFHLVRLVQVNLCVRKDVESSFHGCVRPVKFVQASISAREDQFMSTKDLESCFDHWGVPVKLVHASFSASKAAEGRFYHWDVV